MLHIHRSERADPLVAALGEVLRHPSGDPFASELVAVPSRGVERWLAQQLSHVLGASGDAPDVTSGDPSGGIGGGDGVCANVVFPSSTRLLDDAPATADEAYAASAERWAAERAVWPLMAIIDECAPRQSWAVALAAHLGLDAAGTDKGRRFAVGSKLARHFESYARSRPAMLAAWRDGRNEQGDGTPLPDDLAWQAELWRCLRAELGPSPAELLGTACAALRADAGTTDLPERFSIFGATRIAPSRIEVLSALAENRDLHLWLHHPSPALWQAVAQAAPTPAPRRLDRGHETVRNPLLVSLSRDIRELQQLLHGAAGTDAHHPVATRPDTLLGRLQTELAEDRVPTAPSPAKTADRSLSVHACHGPARQVEVVREVVLGLLAEDPTLEPRDILIMCPDVEAFAPLVAASFGMTEDDDGHPAARLRVRLADRSLRQTNPLLSLLGQVLEIAANRVTATQLLDLAGAMPVRKLFGFTDDDIEQLREWATTGNARWGLDAEHRAPYGLGGVGQGTWRAALDRLLVGVAMEESDQWIGDVLPLDDVDSGDIDLAGRFAEFVDRVDVAVRAMEQPRTVPQWAELLGDTVLTLGEPLQAWQAVQLRSELDDIADAASDTDVRLTRSDVAALLHSRLAGRPTRASFRTGTLTVCTLVPMRSVPHRVVCLVGMDDGAFPRHGVVDGDDVLARDPRTGERDVRSEDRQLFLDAICAAQEHLVITYTGADPRSGAEVPPCVPLGELLDAVDATATAPDGRPGRDHVVIHHPLQPFDPRNFVAGELGTPASFSFDRSGLAGARAASGARHELPPLVDRPLDPHPPETVVDLDDLVRFLEHPGRAFLRQRLGISTWEDDDDPDDALSVALDGLQRWQIGDRVLRNRLAGLSVDTCRELELRRGDLPPGQLGLRLLRDIGQTVDSLLGACVDERSTPPESVDIDLALDDGRRLVGTVGGVRGDTVLAVTYSSLGPKHRLGAWIRHVALVAGTGNSELRSVTVGRRQRGVRRSVLAGVDAAAAGRVLADLVALRDAGLRAPLPMALSTSEAYATRRHSGQDAADALDAARTQWQGGQYDGENVDAAHALVFGGRVPLDDLLGPGLLADDELQFAALARRVWVPLLTAEQS